MHAGVNVVGAADLKARDVKAMRIAYKREGQSYEQLALRWDVSVGDVERICQYDTRVESACIPDESELRGKVGVANPTARHWQTRITGRAQYNKDPMMRPKKVRNPYISYEAVREIRLRWSYADRGFFDVDELSAEYKVGVATVWAIVNGEICMHPMHYPSVDDHEAFRVKSGIELVI